MTHHTLSTTTAGKAALADAKRVLHAALGDEADTTEPRAELLRA